VSFQLEEAFSCSFLQEHLLKLGVGRMIFIVWVDSKRNIDLTSESWINKVFIESIRVIYHIVKNFAFGSSKFFVMWKATVFNHVCQVKGCHVDWITSWSIEVRARRVVEQAPV
jgi:hypothetical protein